MTGEAQIVAVGARTPLGVGTECAAAAVRAGVSRIFEHRFMVDATGDAVLGAFDPLLEPECLGTERWTAMAISPLEEIGTKLAGLGGSQVNATCLISFPDPRPGFKDGDADSIARSLEKLDIPGFGAIKFECAARGHAGSIAALMDAQGRIARREAEVCIVGGIETYVHHETLDWLQVHRQLATSGSRSAFYPGEGAAFVALASESVRRQRGWQLLGTVEGIGVATETKLIKSDEDNLGEGLTRAVLGAFAGRTTRDAIEEIYCDINGERYRAEEWGFVLLHASSLFRDGTGYHCPALGWGDLGAATGALNIALATERWRKDLAAGNTALIWGSSESGVRAAAILERGEL